jgi:rhodanese-related sulfurtransferase
MIDLVKDKNATIVDVRTVEEFSMGCVENSLNIPMHEVPGRIEEFKNMSKPLILCCASGNRSGQVARYLTELGVSEVYNAGGWVDVLDMLEA